jgi:hypothetical protein
VTASALDGSCTRALPTALDQLGAFFGARDEAVNFCDGPCDPN